jgi:hypothetical protein
MASASCSKKTRDRRPSGALGAGFRKIAMKTPQTKEQSTRQTADRTPIKPVKSGSQPRLKVRRPAPVQLEFSFMANGQFSL